MIEPARTADRRGGIGTVQLEDDRLTDVEGRLTGADRRGGHGAVVAEEAGRRRSGGGMTVIGPHVRCVLVAVDEEITGHSDRDVPAGTTRRR